MTGRRFAGGERSDATLHPPENCTSPLLCCYGDAFRLSAPITAAALAFSPFSTFFTLKIGQREHFWNSFLNLSDWRSDLDGDWMLSLSNIVFSCGESNVERSSYPHVSTCCVKTANPTVTAIEKCCLREIGTLDGLVVIEANPLPPPLIPAPFATLLLSAPPTPQQLPALRFEETQWKSAWIDTWTPALIGNSELISRADPGRKPSPQPDRGRRTPTGVSGRANWPASTPPLSSPHTPPIAKCTVWE